MSLKIKLTIAFDGSQYSGWQTQASGVGVQQKVEEALAKLFGQRCPVHSASRTDTGVHAVGMAAHVEVPRARFKMTLRKLLLALNAHLPEDIRVMAAQRRPPNFHARFDAAGKQYRYLVWNHPAHHPLLRSQTWHVARKLNVPVMKEAARHLVGRHDFRSFAANRNYPIANAVRQVRRCDIKRQGPLLTFIIEGDGFLYKMCRGIVGTLVQVGLGKHPPAEVASMLAARDRRRAGMTAPAQGLVLWKVYYHARRPG